MPISESQRKAVAKYNAKAYDRIELKVPKGRKVEIQGAASAVGLSLNGYVNKAIDEKIGRGGEKGDLANVASI